MEVSVAPPLEEAGPAERPLPYAQAIGMSAGAVADTMVLPLGNLEATERLVAEHAAELACVMLDPKSGVLDLPADFIRGVREITARHGVLMVFDEIVGFRLARGGAQEYYGITPDLTTFGKIVGGRLPGGRVRRTRRHHGLLRSGGGARQSVRAAPSPATR